MPTRLSDFYQSFKFRILHSDFCRKVLETFFTQFILLAVNFISAIFISRALGPTLRGVYAVAMAISTIGIQFGNLGLHSSNTYYLARDPKLLPAVIGNTIALSIGLGSICSLAAWFFSISESGEAYLDGTLLYVAVLWIPFGLAYMLFQNVLLGIHEVRAFNKSELFNRILNFLVILFVILCGIRKVSLIFFANYVAVFFTLGYIFYKIKNRLEQRRPYFSFGFLKNSFLYALRTYISCFFAFFVIRCDILFVKHYLGFEQAGYFSVAANAIDILSMFPSVIATLLFPKLSAIDCEETKLHYLKKIGALVFISMLLVSILLYGIAKPMISALYGQAFLPVVPIFYCLLPGLILISVDRVCSTYFGSIGAPLIIIISPICALILKIMINYYLVPSLGVLAIAISSSLGYALMLSMSLIYIYGRQKLSLQLNRQI